MDQSNMPSFPILQSERLMLRQLKHSDTADLFALRSNKNNAKYIDRELTKNNKEIIDFINQRIKDGKNNESFYWAIILKSDNKLIGTICLWNFSDNRKKIEIGYELNPNFQNKGYMDEAVKLVIEFSFKALKVTMLEAFTHVENIASKRLLEKNDFVVRKIIKEKYHTKEGEYEMAVYELSEYFSDN